MFFACRNECKPDWYWKLKGIGCFFETSVVCFCKKSLCPDDVTARSRSSVKLALEVFRQ